MFGLIRKKIQQKKETQKIRIGFAMPEPFDYDAGTCLIKVFDKYESLYGINIRTALAERLNVMPDDILFRNDAEAFLDGELFCGAAAGFNHAIGITLGTGLGSVLSHNGITKDAALSVLEYEGEKIEESVSTRGLVKIYKELTGRSVNDALAIAELYDTDNKAKETFQLFAKYLAWFFKKNIEQESPEILVFGGNIANSFDLFKEELLSVLLACNIRLPKIARASLGEDVALVGGASCFNTRETSGKAKSTQLESKFSNI